MKFIILFALCSLVVTFTQAASKQSLKNDNDEAKGSQSVKALADAARDLNAQGKAIADRLKQLSVHIFHLVEDVSDACDLGTGEDAIGLVPRCEACGGGGPGGPGGPGGK